jgi:formylmethanofuran dehydrogenase subunit E
MMRVKVPKQREWSEGLLVKAVEFHGHGGPFMVIGLRMGLTALKALDAQGWFDLTCRVGLCWRPPDSCIIDGIQSSTGCTMGKHNLEVQKEEDKIMAEFSGSDKLLKIVLKQRVLMEVRGVLAKGDEGSVKELVVELIKADDYALFDVDIVPDQN